MLLFCERHEKSTSIFRGEVREEVLHRGNVDGVERVRSFEHREKGGGISIRSGILNGESSMPPCEQSLHSRLEKPTAIRGFGMGRLAVLVKLVLDAEGAFRHEAALECLVVEPPIANVARDEEHACVGLVEFLSVRTLESSLLSEAWRTPSPLAFQEAVRG